MKLRKWMGCIILLFALFGCENPSEKTNDTDVVYDIQGLLSNGSYDGYLYATRLNVYDNAGNKHQGNRVYSFFYTDTNNSVFPNEVKLNGNSLAEDIDFDQIFALDGIANHIWEVTGGNGIPTFNDTIQSIEDFDITSHVAYDTVNKSQGFTIDYSTISNADDVYVRVEEDTQSSIIYIDSTLTIPSYENYYQAIFNDDGTIEISSLNLSNFNTNRIITVYLLVKKSKVKTVNSKDFIIGSVIQTKINLHLN